MNGGRGGCGGVDMASFVRDFRAVRARVKARVNDCYRVFLGLCTVFFSVGSRQRRSLIPWLWLSMLGVGMITSDASSCGGPEELRRSIETAKIWSPGISFVNFSKFLLTSSI